MDTKGPFRGGLPGNRPFALPLILVFFSCLLGVVIAALMNTGHFSMTLGDVLLIEAVVMFGLAWVGYLKKDGIRFLQPRKINRATAAESWKDRVPNLGDLPSPPQPLPGKEGPSSAEYQRLSKAEQELRKKLMGVKDGEDSASAEPHQGSHFIRDTLLSALLLLSLALVFEYVVPIVAR
ncbi:MAG: hypothetical protein ACYC1A_04870 [Spirochaetales bacterium]